MGSDDSGARGKNDLTTMFSLARVEVNAFLELIGESPNFIL